MIMKYFRLNSESYLVVGKNRAMLHNIIENKSVWLNKNVAKLVKQAEMGSCIQEKDLAIFKILQDNKYGIITDLPVFIDKLRAFNVFNEKKLHKKAPSISSAVLQITNRCDMNCKNCGNFFCPMCMRNRGETLTLDNFKHIIDCLYNYGLRNITLTGGEPALYPYLANLMLYITKIKKMKLFICTSGLIKIPKLHKNCNLIIKLYDPSFISKIESNYRNYDNVTVLEINSKIKFSNYNWKSKSIFQEEPILNKDNALCKVDFDSFNVMKSNDSCLSGKVMISHNGDFYPCFQCKQPVGNIKNREFHELILDIIQKYWTIPAFKKKQKCSICEFRCNCNSCSFMNPDKNCKYNVEEATWG